MKENKTIEKHEEHICRFNDGEQNCDCYDEGYQQGKEEEINLIIEIIENETKLKEYPDWKKSEFETGYNQALEDILKILE